MSHPTLAYNPLTGQFDLTGRGGNFAGPVEAASSVATVGALNSTYSNGTLGVGATLTNATTQAAISIDGVSLSLNDRVLVKDQATSAENGIYKVTTVGSGASNWVLTRTTDYDQPAEITVGSIAPILDGTVNANTLWMETDKVNLIGTDPIIFIRYSTSTITTTNHALLAGGAANAIDSLPLGITGTVLAGVTGADPEFTDTPSVTMISISDVPVNPTDGTNKAYVDSILTGVTTWKNSAEASSISNLTAIYDNGASGEGATLTNSSTLAAFAIDGYTAFLGDRILIKDQTDQTQNGIYIVTIVGSGAVAWELTRSGDYDDSNEILPGTTISITNGAINASTEWLQYAIVATIGTDPIQFSRVTDRLFQTQYVVDPSVVQGLGGAFSTIQSAINQAVTDGMLYTNPKKIYIRTGAYTENLTIPGGTILVGETFSMPTGGLVTPTPTVINGVHSLSGNAVCAFNNITFNNIGGSSDMFTSGAVDLLYFNNCLLQSTSTGNFINNTAASSTYKFTDCSFSCTGDQTYFTSNQSSSHLFMQECFFQQPAGFDWQGDINFSYCQGLGPVILSASSTIFAYFSSFISSITGQQISGTGTGSIIGCLFQSIPALANTVDPSIRFTNNSCGDFANSTAMFETGTVYNAGKSQQGCIIKSIQTAMSYNVDPEDYYIGVTDTSAPRTITLLDGMNTISQDQVFIIKDESGGAFTNNITVQATTALIDGQASKLINTNFGSLSVKYDGTNYFII